MPCYWNRGDSKNYDEVRSGTYQVKSVADYATTLEGQNFGNRLRGSDQTLPNP
jgi:hypothetical protein